MKVFTEEIKTYFDSHISQLLLGSTRDVSNSGALVELGREVCTLKLVIKRLEDRVGKAEDERDVFAKNSRQLTALLQT